MSVSLRDSLRPLLQCPLCPSHSPLVYPTTLRCGHTVCASHLHHHSIPDCPLPVCPPAIPESKISQRIPPNSSVSFHPAIILPLSPPRPPQPPTGHADPTVDITVNKIIDLVSQSDISRSNTTATHPSDTSSDEDDDVSAPLPPAPSLSTSLTSHTPSQSSRSHSRPSTGSDTSHTSTRRPSKRPRSLSQRPNTTVRDSGGSDDSNQFEKVLLTELSCEICFMLFYQPVTTPCQHTFCAKCLQRSLDYRTHCPICRQLLPEYAYFQDHPCNKVVLSVILNAFPDVYAERGRAIDQEERDARLNTPIFVCQLSFPGVPTVLHFFEPRYRLMLRRCLESPTPRFGMIMPPKDSTNTTTQDFGTMLQIRRVQMLPDGRSMLHTLGISRFRILEKDSLDGYMVGRIEAIEDLAEDLDILVDELDIDRALQLSSEPTTPSTQTTEPRFVASTSSSAESLSSTPISGSPSRVPVSYEALMSRCHSFLEQLRVGAAPWVVQKMNESYGPMPTNPAKFSFWMALVLPIDDQEKAKLLPIKSTRLRLRLIVHWIDQLKSHWYDPQLFDD